MRPLKPLIVLHISITLLLALTSGCASPISGGDKLLKFHATDNESFAAAPKDGKYIVAYRQEGSGELWQAPGTTRKISKGDQLGFLNDANGHLVAVAAGREKTLGQMPIIASYACWYHVPNNYGHNRPFMKNLVATVKVASMVAVIGGLAAGASYLQATDNGDDDSDWSPHKSKRSTDHEDHPKHHYKDTRSDENI